MLRKTRYKEFQFINVDILNSYVATSLQDCDSEKCSIMIKLNKTRHRINIKQMKKFAKKKTQKIYVFCFDHDRCSFFEIVDLTLFLKTQNKFNILFFELLFLNNANIVFYHVNNATNELIEIYSNFKNKQSSTNIYHFR